MAKSARKPFLDGLRAVAALMVALHHFTSGVFFRIGDFGRIGVLLFFLISGYCIFLSLRSAARHLFFGFVVRRFFRLYPAYWVSIGFTAFVALDAHPVRDYLVNLTMIQALFGVSPMRVQKMMRHQHYATTEIYVEEVQRLLEGANNAVTQI